MKYRIFLFFVFISSLILTSCQIQTFDHEKSDEFPAPNESFINITQTYTPIRTTTESSPKNSLKSKCLIAFYSRRDGDDGLFIMQSDGSNVKKLTGDANYYVWSPDGKQIAFYSDLNDKNGVYLVNIDGSDLHQLATISTKGFNSLSWSPNRKYLAFTDNKDVYSIDASSGLVINLTTDFSFDWVDVPVLSPDSSKIALQIYYEKEKIHWLSVLDVNKHTLKNIRYWGQHPSWSPDGEKIVFIDQSHGRYNISIVNANGNNLRILNVVNEGKIPFYPVWSHDGKKIAFLTTRWEDDEVVSEINVMDRDGKNLIQLIHDQIENYGWHPYRPPQWSPDGKKFVFSTRKDYPSYDEIYVIDQDGNNLRKLSDNTVDDSSPIWSPDCY